MGDQKRSRLLRVGAGLCCIHCSNRAGEADGRYPVNCHRYHINRLLIQNECLDGPVLGARAKTDDHEQTNEPVLHI